MQTLSPAFGQSFFRRWLLMTVVGWMLGFVMLVVLASLWSGLGTGEAQWMVGVGMGAGVGLLQSRLLRESFGIGWSWVWASTIGMGLPFVASDLARTFELGVPFILPVDILFGGLLAGLMQWRSLSPPAKPALWWIPASALGWALGAATTFVVDNAVPGHMGPLLRLAIFILVILLGGGLLLGSVTGSVLVRLLTRREVVPEGESEKSATDSESHWNPDPTT